MYSLIPDKKIEAVAPSKSDPNRAINIACGALLAATFLVVVALAASGYALPWSGAASAAVNVEACVMAQTFVEDQLKAPSSAEFAPCRPPDTRVSNSGASWVVVSWVDADNSFGAKIRNNYTVQMSYSPAGKMWTPVDVTIAGR